MLVRGRAGRHAALRAPELAAVARLLGYPPDGGQDLAGPAPRRPAGPRVMERLFYG